jgi:MFS family permease
MLAMLTVISGLNIYDRTLLSLVLPLIKAELAVSDTALGLASGLAFALFYSAMGVPIARLADRWNRRNIIAIGLFFWSLMTAFTGAVSNIWQLAACRFLMGAGEASSLAPSNSIIADLFTKARRPLALSVFATGTGLGALVFTPIGAWIAQTYGWRAAFVAAGLPGMCLTLVFVLAVREPERGASESQPIPSTPPSFAETARFLAGSRAYLLVLAAACLIGACMNGLSAWSSTFLVRVHHLNIVTIGAALGLIQGVLGTVGTLAGGFLADQLGRSKESWRLRVPGIACLLAALALLLYVLAPTVAGALTGMGLAVMFFSMPTGPMYAACVSVAKPRMRATAVAALLFGVGVIGQILGAVTIGILNDALHPIFGEAAIRYSMLVVALAVLLAGVAYTAAARFLEADAARALP